MENEAVNGCRRCLGDDADRVWASRPFETLAELLDELHFSIRLVQCRGCGQAWVKVFMEEVDFAGGDDAQTWILVPLTPAEASELRAAGDAVSTKRIEALSDGRRCLVVDHPTGGEKSCWWRDGPVWILRR